MARLTEAAPAKPVKAAKPAKRTDDPKAPSRRCRRRVARASKRLRKAERQAARQAKRAARAQGRVDRLQQQRAAALAAAAPLPVRPACAPRRPTPAPRSQPPSQSGRPKQPWGAHIATWWRNLSMPGAFSVYVTFYLLIALVGSILSSNYFLSVRDTIQQDAQLYNGVFIYDADEDALLPARLVVVESKNSPVGYSVLYVQNYSGTDHIAPAALPSSVTVLDVTDYPHDIAYTGLASNDPSSSELTVEVHPNNGGYIDKATLATYNELACKAWSDAAGEQDTAFLRNSAGLLISPVAYYLHEPPAPEARIAEGLVGALAFLMFPLWFGLCIYMAGRRFYAQRIKPALELFDAATVKIAEQDLDFAVAYNRTDELGRLAESFETMRSSLAQSQRALWATAEERRHLNAAFAHDLRTPLTILHGKIELLQARADAGTIDPERLAEACRTLASQVERLERYVCAMSGVQRLEDRVIARTPLAVETLARDLGEAGAQLCRASSVSFQWEKPAVLAGVCAVAADRTAVAEVAENLIGNAARYAASQVTARLEVAEADGGLALSLVVADDGPGFSTEALVQGREPFFSESKTEGHFGLGLNISQLLCQKHGGALALANRTDGPGALVTASFRCTAVSP